METNLTPSHDASSTDEVVFPTPSSDATDAPPRRIGWFEGHMPELVDPLDPRHPETSFEETRRLRHDGWTPEKMRLFHERFAECGVVREACEAAGMSARSAYNLRDRDPLFAAGWEAASLKARTRLADEAFSRSLNGVVERIYKDGAIVAERHRYDNRLTMAVLARLDARIDRAEERGDPRLNVVARWDEYLAALGEGRREDGLALFAPPPAPPVLSAVEGPAACPERGRGDPQKNAGDRELRELPLDGEAEFEARMSRDPHRVWEDEEGWWTDYPPPAGFDGEESGRYGDFEYRRKLSPAEQAITDSDIAAIEAEDRAQAEAQRDAWFDLGRPSDSEPGATSAAEQSRESTRAGRPAAPPTGSTRSGLS